MKKLVYYLTWKMSHREDEKDIIPIAWKYEAIYWSFDEAEEKMRTLLEIAREHMERYYPGWNQETVKKAYHLNADILVYNPQRETDEYEEWIEKLKAIHGMSCSDEEKWRRVFEDSKEGIISYDIEGNKDSKVEIPTEGWKHWLSQNEFLRRESKFMPGDVVIDKENYIYVVFKKQLLIMECNVQDDFDYSYYSLEGINPEGNYSFIMPDQDTDDQDFEKYTGEIKEGSFLDILRKIIKEEYPPLGYTLEKYIVDTGYNHIVPYQKLFVWDESET